MAALRDETKEHHDNAENHTFQRALFKGQLGQDEYARFLGQMLLLHEALEQAIRSNNDGHPAFETVIRDYQHQSPYLREDLEFLGSDADSVEPGPGVEDAINRIQAVADDALALLGMHYVLEGSNNGSKYIGMSLAKTFGWRPGGPGLRYMDPYGDQQKAYWQAFKDDMGEVEFSDGDIEKLVEAAKSMYGIVASISDDLEKTPA